MCVTVFQRSERSVEQRTERGRGKGEDAELQSCQPAAGLRRVDAGASEGCEYCSISVQEASEGTHWCVKLQSPSIFFLLTDSLPTFLTNFPLWSTLILLPLPPLHVSSVTYIHTSFSMYPLFPPLSLFLLFLSLVLSVHLQ